MKFLKFRHFYVLGLLFSLFLYWFPEVFGLQAEQRIVADYAGNAIYLLFFVLALYAVRMWIRQGMERVVFEIRIYLFLVSFLSFLAFALLWQAGVDFHTMEMTKDIQTNLLDASVYRYHLGWILSYGLYLLTSLEKYPYYYYLNGLLGLAIFSLFLLLFKPIKRKIQTTRERRREEARQAKEEALLHEQLEIKRALEREEYRKIKRFEQRKAQMIEERSKAFAIGELLSTVPLLEEEEEEEQEDKTNEKVLENKE